MKRPMWEPAPRFASAWQHLHALSKSREDAVCAESARLILVGLSEAHVVTIDREQLTVLPPPGTTRREASNYFEQLRLPFATTFFEIVGPPINGLVGALSKRHSNGSLIVVPALAGDGFTAMPVVMTMLGVEPGGETEWEQTRGAATEDVYRAICELSNDQVGALRSAPSLVARTTFLLDAANVELTDIPPSRQIRRNAARKGAQIAFTVRVRQSSRRPVPRENGEHVSWSHRWEVRGHYKHFTKGSHTKDESKLAPCPQHGMCRREWSPPHVKGPEDKPLIPKVRVVDG